MFPQANLIIRLSSNLVDQKVDPVRKELEARCIDVGLGVNPEFSGFMHKGRLYRFSGHTGKGTILWVSKLEDRAKDIVDKTLTELASIETLSSELGSQLHKYVTKVCSLSPTYPHFCSMCCEEVLDFLGILADKVDLPEEENCLTEKYLSSVKQLEDEVANALLELKLFF